MMTAADTRVIVYGYNGMCVRGERAQSDMCHSLSLLSKDAAPPVALPRSLRCRADGHDAAAAHA